MSQRDLLWEERLYYRDQLRSARYATLADAEGFLSICFALEALGLRLHGKKEALGTYRQAIKNLAESSVVLSKLSGCCPAFFSTFNALYAHVVNARNDAMHTGVYARSATAAAIELCIGMEEALMAQAGTERSMVKDFMVKSPITVESWQPVAHARQLMLTHSFSFLPVKIGSEWKLISEGAMARYLRSGGEWKTLLAATVENAGRNDLELIAARVVGLDANVDQLLGESSGAPAPRIWLVDDSEGRLCGVLTPFELM